jgi:hypothetical protein
VQESPRPRWTVAAVVGVSVAVAAAVLQLLGLIAKMRRSGDSAPMLIGLSLTAILAVGMLGVFWLAGRRRVSGVRRRHPRATLGSLVTTPSMIDAVIEAGGRRISSSSYSTLVIDEGALHLYAGWDGSRARLSVPFAEIADVRIGWVRAGVRTVRAVEVVLHGEVVLPLCIRRGVRFLDAEGARAIAESIDARRRGVRRV